MKPVDTGVKKRETTPPVKVAFFLSLGILAAASTYLYAEVSTSTLTTPTPAVSTATTPSVPVTSTVTAPSVPAATTVPTPPPAPPAAAAPAAGTAEYIGADTCISCHQDKAAFHDALHARSFSQFKGIDFQHSCETCHGPGSLHAAAAGDKSNPGFFTIKDFRGASAQKVAETCLQCHQDENRIHWVGSVHERRNVSCLACHSVHQPKEEKLLLVRPRIEEVCAQCHQDIVAKIHRSAHMPILEGKMDCTSCHNPHGSATPKMLNQESVTATCYTCHADKRGPFVWEHPPVREDCLNCHDPHGSHNDHMLVAREPFLCQRCHIGTRHTADPYDQTSINAGSSRMMGDSCTNCHSNIHGSNAASGELFQR